MNIARYKIHPAANIFPLMSNEELARLAADIQLHGLNEKVVLLNGAVLDGRNRLRACDKIGRGPTFRELGNCDDPIGFVLAANLHRRQLTTSQRAFAAARIANLKNGANQHERRVQGGQNCPPITVDDAARMFAVSPMSIKTAKRVIERAHPSVVTVFERHKISVFLAARFVAKVKDKKEQRRIAELGVEAIRKAVNQPRKELKLSQHVEKLVDVITKIREKWPPEHLTTLTEKLASLTTEMLTSKGVRNDSPLKFAQLCSRTHHRSKQAKAEEEYDKSTSWLL